MYKDSTFQPSQTLSKTTASKQKPDRGKEKHQAALHEIHESYPPGKTKIAGWNIPHFPLGKYISSIRVHFPASYVSFAIFQLCFAIFQLLTWSFKDHSEIYDSDLHTILFRQNQPGGSYAESDSVF